ncbi:Spermatogenesis-defective protein 39-like protein, partial [Armadillidium nasatum]
MDDFWNNSETAPSTLDNFFDEESDVNWTGTSKDDSTKPQNTSNNDYYCSPTQQEVTNSKHRSSLSSGSLSSILDNISTHSDSAISGISGSKNKVGKALGEKLEALKPSVSNKWKIDGGSSHCSNCSAKNEEIHQLKMRLERAYSKHNISLPPEDTIQRIMLGHPYSLECYRMMDDKIKLLDCALDTMDSSTILLVLVFLKNTMKMSYFLKELQKRPHAIQVMLGRTEEAAMFKYELALQSQTSDLQIKNLVNALGTVFKDPFLTHESQMVKQHIELIEIQTNIDNVDSKDQSNAMLHEYPRATSLLGQSLLTSLYYSSMYHWHEPENVQSSPLFLKRNFKIADRQFLWTVLRARAKVKHWPLPTDLDNLLATKGLIGTLTALSGMSGGGKIVKNTLPIERVIDSLAATGAPSNVLSSYINLLGSNELKLKYGFAYKCHLAVIEAYIAQKNREGLETYLKQMTFGSPEYVKAEQALK